MGHGVSIKTVEAGIRQQDSSVLVVLLLVVEVHSNFLVVFDQGSQVLESFGKLT
jgi:hypothetical protein